MVVVIHNNIINNERTINLHALRIGDKISIIDRNNIYHVRKNKEGIFDMMYNSSSALKVNLYFRFGRLGTGKGIILCVNDSKTSLLQQNNKYIITCNHPHFHPLEPQTKTQYVFHHNMAEEDGGQVIDNYRRNNHSHIIICK